MSFDRRGEDFFITGSVSAASFYGDGSNLTGISGGGGGLTGSGTNFYISKWTSTGTLTDSNIQDYGYPFGVGINYAPQTGVQLAVGNAVNPTTIYSLNNYATSSTTRAGYFQNYGNPGTGSKLGIEVSVPTGTDNYALKLTDGRQATGYVLTSDANGNAYWSAPTGGSGATPSLAQVLSVGAQANTAIDMNGNMIYGISQIGVRATAGAGYIDFATPAVNWSNATLLTLMYNT